VNTSMRFAYADPPYLGMGKKLYSKCHAQAEDCDSPEWHRALIARLSDEYPAGWALSCASTNLPTLLPMCPADIRVAAWVKPFAVFKPNVNPAYAWEPVLFRGGRKALRTDPTVRDWHSENITMKKGLPGAKPGGFSLWILQLLRVRFDLGDTIDDLFPGTGSVMSAWRSV